MVRGLRAISDFEFEFQMALMNRKLEASVETNFLMPKEEYTYLSSRIVKEIARLGGDVGFCASVCVVEALDKRRSDRKFAMKIHLRQIPPERLHLEGEEECPLPQLNSEEARCTGPLRYALEVGVSEGALWVSGELVQPVELQCVRCLESSAYEIKVQRFRRSYELTGPEEDRSHAIHSGGHSAQSADLSSL